MVHPEDMAKAATAKAAAEAFVTMASGIDVKAKYVACGTASAAVAGEDVFVDVSAPSYTRPLGGWRVGIRRKVAPEPGWPSSARLSYGGGATPLQALREALDHAHQRTGSSQWRRLHDAAVAACEAAAAPKASA